MAIKNPKNSIRQFAAIIRSLESDRGEVRRLSEWCIKRRQEISWDANARKMVELYNKAMEKVEIYKTTIQKKYQRGYEKS